MKKEITELRVYSTMQRLKHDFDRLMRSDFLQDKHNAKIQPYREIYIPNVYRMVFVVDDGVKFRGFRPNKVFIDEMVSVETKDYLDMVTSHN